MMPLTFFQPFTLICRLIFIACLRHYDIYCRLRFHYIAAIIGLSLLPMPL